MSSELPSIRLATAADAAPMLAIYAPVVRETSISFEVEPPDEDEFAERVRAVLRLAPWIVAQIGGEVAGYAYGSSFRARPAYRFTVETTVYVHADHRRRGVGRALYAALLHCLRLQGFRRAIGGITLPNAASVALHEACGFRPVGVFDKVGFKFGRWHGVGFWDMELADHVAAPPEPLSVADAAALPQWSEGLDRAAAMLCDAR